jgi:hypothetical protein
MVPSTQRPWRLPWPAWLAISLLALLSIVSTLGGLADVFRARAETILGQQGDAIRTSPTRRQAQAALEAYTLASRLDAWRPDLQAAVGDMHALLAAGRPVWEAESKAHNRAARDAYRTAIQRRPSWPYAWANLAVVKFRLAELDREFFTALERAVTLGPWEPEIQKTVADLGLAAWKLLPEETRTPVRASLERGLHRQGETIISLAARYGRLDVLAPLVEGNGRLEAMVQGERARATRQRTKPAP